MSVDFSKEIEKLVARSQGITENTELYQFIKQINSQMDSNGVESFNIKKYCRDSEMNTSIVKPFLTVVLRTQGTRSLGLREALLSLRAQTNNNFEVIVVAHKASVDGKNTIKSIISSQPKSFQDRIRYIELDEGTRTSPINLGCANARGEYVSMYDDDDILFENWVDVYYESAKSNRGKVLHAYALAQKWKETSNGYVAISAPTMDYCTDFNALSQLVVNKCPLMGMAFPTYLFRDMGFAFNENLDVTEDWEFMMRVTPITGVADIKVATSIYRFWINAESSYTIHGNDVWAETYSKIHKQMDERLLLVPAGSVKSITYLINAEYKRTHGTPTGFPKLMGILFYSGEEKFTDEKIIRTDNQYQSPNFKMEFSLPQEAENARYFRVDPCEYGGLMIFNLKITMETKNGKKISVNVKECYGNGMWFDTGLYFLHYDPQIIWESDGVEGVVKIIVEGETTMDIPEDAINMAIKQQSLIEKVKRRTQKLIGRVRCKAK